VDKFPFLDCTLKKPLMKLKTLLYLIIIYHEYKPYIDTIIYVWWRWLMEEEEEEEEEDWILVEHTPT